VPCAGPVLAAIAVAGATGKFGPSTLALTVAFAVGTALPSLVFALAGWRISDRIQAFRTRQKGTRIAAGVVVVGLAVALTFNVTDAVQRAIPDYTNALSDKVNEAGAVAKALGTGGASGALPGATEVPDLTLTSEFQTPETYLGAGRAQGYQGNTPLRPGTGTYTAPGKLAENAFALDGTWAVTAESITSKQNAVITLNYTAEDVYLYVGGTGTVTVTAPGRTRAYQVRGAPNIYTVVHTKALDSGTLKVSLSPGLSAYSFTFG
jgi:thioredoxin family protein/cytochrome c biogenesis DsbD-like protein